MNQYIEGIQSIMGIYLIFGEIENYPFNKTTLLKLTEFSENYKEDLLLNRKNNGLTTFLSFPEIISNDFNTYKGTGELPPHWPDDIDLAIAVLLNDKVVLHDHLAHYAKAPLSGYTVGYQYSGIRNWLKALAEWKPLIEENVICIVPKKLSYSDEVKEIWGYELSGLSKEILCNHDSEVFYMIDNKYDSEYIYDINRISYVLAALSISRNNNKTWIPYFNDEEEFEHYQNVLNSFLDIAETKFHFGKQPGTVAQKTKRFYKKVNFTYPFNPSLLINKNLIKQLRNSSNSSRIRNDLKNICHLFSNTDDLSTERITAINQIMEEKKRQWNKLYTNSNSNSKQIVLEFNAQILPGIKSKNHQQKVYKTIFDLYDNILVEKRNPDLLLHFYLGVKPL